MSSSIMIIDGFALLAMIAGALMVFRQRQLRRWWAALRGRHGPAERGQAGGARDPAAYALIIFGMMLLAFGLLILGFFTTFALLT